MRIQHEKRGDVCVLRLQGKLAVGDGDRELRAAFRRLLDQGESKILINMGELAYVDSAGLGETVACMKRAREKSGDVRLVLGSGGKPEEVFVLTWLDRIFQIYPSEEEGLAGFSS